MKRDVLGVGLLVGLWYKCCRFGTYFISFEWNFHQLSPGLASMYTLCRGMMWNCRRWENVIPLVQFLLFLVCFSSEEIKMAGVEGACGGDEDVGVVELLEFDYGSSLQSAESRSRYQAKLETIGMECPYTLAEDKWSLDPTMWPALTLWQLCSYNLNHPGLFLFYFQLLP